MKPLSTRLRMRAGAALVDPGWYGLALGFGARPVAWPRLHGVERHKDLAYGDLPQQRADVYRSRDARGLLPVCVYVHGGGFRILSKETHWLMALVFARRGYLVVNLDYRLAPAHPYPAALEDVSAGIRWAVEHAARWGGDPSRLVLAGESAGANLVTAATVAACYERPEAWARPLEAVRPAAVMPFCGIHQVSDTARYAGDGLPWWALDRIVECEDVYLQPGCADGPGGAELADPLLVLEQGRPPARPLPPFFLPVGTGDPLQQDNERLAAALRALGVAVDERVYPGEVHAFQALLWRANARRCWRDAFAFLERHVDLA